jgi:hypothetical protein
VLARAARLFVSESLFGCGIHIACDYHFPTTPKRPSTLP